jgi:hypothetical protein
MSACGIAPPGAPVVRLTLVGSGEPLMRLEKRLTCAAGGLGLALDLTVRKDPEALGIAFADTPAILIDGRLAHSGLVRTEALENWLREHFADLVPSRRDTPG